MPDKRSSTSKWRRDLTLEPWRERLITLFCGMGILVPLFRAYKAGEWNPLEWNGDRILIIGLFLAIGYLSVTLPDD